MSKNKIVNTQCRRCLGQLTYVDVESNICKCGKSKKEHFGDNLFCNNPLGVDSVFKPILVKKLYHKDLCKKCLDKDDRKKRRIKRNQKRIGIKQTRRKKKIQWKSKQEPLSQNNPIEVVFVKKNKRHNILIKFSPKDRWRKVTIQKLRSLEKKYSLVWNPVEERKQSTV